MFNLIVNACDAMTEYPPDERTLTISTEQVGTAVRNICHATTAPVSPVIRSRRVPAVRDVEASRARPRPHDLPVDRRRARRRMWAANNVGRGATFHVMLPASSEQVRPTAMAGRVGTGDVARRRRGRARQFRRALPNGMATMNAAPPAVGSLSHQMTPPCASTIVRLMDRPTPRPFFFEVMNGSKIAA